MIVISDPGLGFAAQHGRRALQLGDRLRSELRRRRRARAARVSVRVPGIAGNLVGGSVLVALVCHVIYRRPVKVMQ
jgi:hypothetical protein